MKHVAIFEGLNAAQRKVLEPLLEFCSCPSGVVIFQQGEPAEFWYLLMDGKVEISFKPEDGVPLTVSHVSNGGLFGWSAVVGSDIYTSSAIAIENLEVIRIRGSQFKKFCREHPEAGTDILERLADGVCFRCKDSYTHIQSILSQAMKE